MRLSSAPTNSSILHACHPERSEGPMQFLRARRRHGPAGQGVSLAFVLVLALLVTAAAQDTPSIEAQHYDGNWWKTTSTEERTAFITGSEECRNFDRRLVRKQRWSDEDYARALDRYYQKNSAETGVTVAVVMDKLNPAAAVPQPRRPARKPAAKPVTALHGTLDGTWWRGAAGDEQLGFVEGYLSCRAQIRAAKPLRFSKRALDYVQMTSTYYADDAKHEPEKLADLLARFRDEPPKPGKR